MLSGCKLISMAKDPNYLFKFRELCRQSPKVSHLPKFCELKLYIQKFPQKRAICARTIIQGALKVSNKKQKMTAKVSI